MKLNWFSPLPPRRAAAAQTTRGLLPALTKATGVRLWSDTRDVDPQLARAAEVRFYDPAAMIWAELNRSGINVYHLDDDLEAHGSIWRVSRQAPGIVVLHDHRLHHLVAGAHRARDSGREEYLALMERQYGENGRHDALSHWEGWMTAEAMARTYPLSVFACERALGVVVHTREAQQALEGRLHCPIRRLALPHPMKPRPARREARGGLVRIVSFGASGPGGRTIELLHALAEHPRRRAFELEVFGPFEDERSLLERTHTLGIADRVTLHPEAKEAALSEALDSADVAVNLRHPPSSLGAATQLCIWEHELPSVVTRSGWLGELPDSAVAFVRPDHEAGDLKESLSALLDEPARFRRMGAVGRAILEREHAPQAWIRGLLELAEDGARLRPGLAAARALRRAGDETARLTTEHAAPPRVVAVGGPGLAELSERGPVPEAARRVLARWQSELQSTLKCFVEAVDERARHEEPDTASEQAP